MKKIELSNNKKIMLLEAIAFLTLGILFCCSIAVDSLLGTVLGIALLICGILIFVVGWMSHKIAITAEGITASLLMSLGIVFFIQPPQLTTIISMFLTVLGAILLFDGLLGCFVKNLHRKTSSAAIETITGACSLTLGLCLYFIKNFQRYAGLVLGIIFIILALLLLIYILLPEVTGKSSR